MRSTHTHTYKDLPRTLHTHVHSIIMRAGAAAPAPAARLTHLHGHLVVLVPRALLGHLLVLDALDEERVVATLAELHLDVHEARHVLRVFATLNVCTHATQQATRQQHR